MRYISTRGAADPQTFCDVLLEGLASDGGLAIPENYPQFTQSDLEAMKQMDYRTLAYTVLSAFITDIDADALKALVDATYTAETYCNGRDSSRADEITPLLRLDDHLFIQELSNGPTLAFKDMAMQFLGNAFEYVLAAQKREVCIVGATSGDTGSAAEYALRGKAGVRVVMLSPHGKMSPFQRGQMFSIQDENIHNIAVKSMFDGCQDLVKAVNRDADFKERYSIAAVNSINWGRIAAQVVYYFWGYLHAADKVGEAVDFSVPSGNFGNVCAGHIARQMGLPIRRLIVATNENDVLDEFFKTGRYVPRSDIETHETSSPSMDISKASNLERFVFDVLGRDAKKLAALWSEIDRGGSFALDADAVERMTSEYGFCSAKSSHANRCAAIKEVYETWGIYIDPHTADGYCAAKELRDPKVKMVILETALAAKFEETIIEALGKPAPRPAHLCDLETLPQRVVVMEADLEVLKRMIAETCE